MVERRQESARDDEPLWRFMDFTKYVSMLHRRALYFARADTLADPFEGLYTRRCARSADGSDPQEMMRRRVYLSCWHRNDHESAAMWRIYLSGEQGVAVRTNVERLVAGLPGHHERLVLGPVHYFDDRRERVSGDHELDPFFCKRKSFDYEREMRLLWAPEQATDDVGRYIEADLERVIERVIVAPAAEPWLCELVASVTAKYGLEIPVERSAMLDPPEP